MSEFEGKTAIITGAAQGMGAAYARLLAQTGANVVIADIAEEKATQTANEIVRNGGNAIVTRTDVGSVESCEACAARALEAFGRIDYVVNNAGLLSAAREKKLSEIDYDRYRQVLDIMMHGMLFLSRAALPALKRQGGAIVNTSSIGAWTANGIYSLSKAGVNALTVCLARELAPFGIRVNAVAPGAVYTEGTSVLFESREKAAEWAVSRGKPTADIADPEDIARAGIFLLSDAASYVNGVILNVDGGQVVRL